jgi:enterochelin esterase family protein
VLRGLALAGLLFAASCSSSGRGNPDPNGTGGSNEGGGTGGGGAGNGGNGGNAGNAGWQGPADGGTEGEDAAADGPVSSPVACQPAQGSPPDGGSRVTDPGGEGDGDVVIGPTYVDAPELLGMLGVPRGTLKSFTVTSPTYPGINGPYTRSVTLYIPNQYVPGTPAPFIVVLDGSSFVTTLPATLNNMINDGRLPVMIAILINPGSERGLEYDTVSNAYANFIESEVLPKVQQDYGVTLTSDPDGRAAMGWSSGGAAAFTMGWQCPSLYRRILTYSGTFVNARADAQSPHGAWEYHEHLIPQSDPRPLRVFLEVGDRDNGAAEPETTYRNWVLANQRMAAALKAKGYHYRFVTATNAGHIDARVFAQTLPETLAWLWRGYPLH